MLARDRRLRRARDINRVYAKGRYGGTGQLSAKALASGLDTTRTAIIVSRKVSKKAVVRNRIRRRLAAILVEYEQVKLGYDIVITVREDVSEMAAAELKKQVLLILSKAGAINEK